MRRKEFLCEEPLLASRILRECPVGQIAFRRGDSLELLPYNFVYLRDNLYFHSSPETGLAGAVGQSVRFLAYDTVAWIPSTWRHPELACPATTYFQSLSLESTLRKVEDLTEKAAVLEAFMSKYQDDPYKPLSDAAYRGPLAALGVFSLAVENVVVKNKMGQHLTPAQRQKVFARLQARSNAGDARVVRAMREANSELAQDQWVDWLQRSQTEKLAAMLSECYWARGRTAHQQWRLNCESQVTLAKCRGEDVLAFCRVNVTGPRNGYLSDVVVHPDHRGRGLGSELMERLLRHPRIAGIRRLILSTQDQAHFYQRFGFVTKFETDTVFMLLEK